MTTPMTNPGPAREALKDKPWAYRLGTFRMWQQHGQAYAEMFKGSLTAGGIVGAIAYGLGITSKPKIVMIGIASVIFWQVLAVVCGYIAWRTKVIHHTLGTDWKNDEWKVRMLAALEKMTETIARMR